MDFEFEKIFLKKLKIEHITTESNDDNENEFTMQQKFTTNEDNTLVKLELTASINHKLQGIRFESILNGYFRLNAPLKPELDNELFEYSKKFTMYMWPYLTDLLSSLSAKMNIEKPIILPVFNEDYFQGEIEDVD